jgi:putative ABC transport system permease protein
MFGWLELKMGWRNILRHNRRSLVTLLSVVSGVVAVVLFGGFIQANYEGLRESVIRSQYGHLQIYAAGYIEQHRQAPDKFRLSPRQQQAVMEIAARSPQHVATSRRLEFTGLIGKDDRSEAALIRGVDPDGESLINSALTVIAGQELSATASDGALLGEGLAQAIGAKVGDQLTLLVSTAGGVMNAVDVRVEGIFRSFAKEYDDRAMLMDLGHAQKALGTQGVDAVVLLIQDTLALPGVVAELDRGFAQAGLKVEHRAWHELATFYQKVVSLYDGFFAFIVAVIAVVVLLGIANTMMVAVMERTSEIGTLRALGTPQGGIVRQFVVEGLLLACLSAVVGVVVAVFAAKGISGLEIMMAPPPGSSRGYPLRIASVPAVWAASVAGVMAIALLATCMPAAGAARKPIVDALRHV